MVKKSSAQIRRMEKRAAGRGDEYIYEEPEPKAEMEQNKTKEDKSTEEDEEASPSTVDAGDSTKLDTVDAGNTAKLDTVDTGNIEKLEAAASKLKKELDKIETDEGMKAKERRSAKRKAEAIATEESSMPAPELLEWYEKQAKSKPDKKSGAKSGEKTPKEGGKFNNPYIAFVGQMAYDSTRESLFEHIKKELGKEFKVTQESVKIRILTDAKTKKSRGMAFVEVDDPELLYALLRLHQTFLEGRRINIERSAGGKNTETKKAKITQYRKEQDAYFADVIDKMLGEYRARGELREDEFDEGVISLCKRHAAHTVQAALEKYIEGGGCDMDNPSAYFSFLIGKFAEEGIFEPREKGDGKGGDRKGGDRDRFPKRKQPQSDGGAAKKPKSTNTFSTSGVDMSISQGKDLSKIFPSSTRGGRGRGRGGRGYMRG
jgi:RNA recognition motif-containing protein